MSLATPYNLFGSKRAVLVAVIEDIKGFSRRFGAYRNRDPLERLLRAAEIAISYYEEDPLFYRVLWTTVLSGGGEGADARSAIFNPKRDAFWRDLLGDARARGLLLGEIEIERLMAALDYSFRSVMLHWVIGETSLVELQPKVGFSYALALRGAATTEGQALLLPHVMRYQQRLAEIAVRERAASTAAAEAAATEAAATEAADAVPPA